MNAVEKQGSKFYELQKKPDIPALILHFDKVVCFRAP